MEDLYVTAFEMCFIYLYSTMLQKGFKDQKVLPHTGMKKKSKDRNSAKPGLRLTGQKQITYFKVSSLIWLWKSCCLHHPRWNELRRSKSIHGTRFRQVSVLEVLMKECSFQRLLLLLILNKVWWHLSCHVWAGRQAILNLVGDDDLRRCRDNPASRALPGQVEMANDQAPAVLWLGEL